MNAADIAVSVIVPCYNDGRFLPEAVRSAEFDSQGRHEIIVVDDGSNDPETLTQLAEIGRRGHQVLHQENRGLGAARNRGIAAARGRYILPLDADNRIRPAYIDRGREILDREPAVDVVYGDAEYFGEKTGRWQVPAFDLRRMLNRNYIDACAVYRKSAWARHGGYDEKMPVQGFEDWDFWSRLGCGGSGFRHVDEVLFDYRVRANSMSAHMLKPPHAAASWRHLRAKKIEIPIGEYVHWQNSWDFAVEQFRLQPFRTLANLVFRAYFPAVHARLRARRHDPSHE